MALFQISLDNTIIIFMGNGLGASRSGQKYYDINNRSVMFFTNRDTDYNYIAQSSAYVRQSANVRKSTSRTLLWSAYKPSDDEGCVHEVVQSYI